MLLLVKNNRIDPDNAYFKEIISTLKSLQINFSIIENYPFTKEDITKLQKYKIIISFGGDGTIFSLLHYMEKLEQSFILPINFGRLGYITSISGKESLSIVKNLFNLEESLKKKRLKIDKRNLIKIESQNKNYLCLNEITIKGKIQGKPTDFDVCLNGENLLKFKADGIIIATATGSTAYNLSAGGPILAPNIEAFVFTPISPHSLTLKPIVLAKNDELKINFDEDKVVFLDGQLLNEKINYLNCKLAKEKLAFIKPYRENHFGSLKDKLYWGKNLY